jgi:hypothetical protein
MTRLHFFPFTTVTILLAVTMLVHCGCANIIPPAGGPRDSIPPILLRSTPQDSVRNFGGNRIVMSFNEFIELQNVAENVVISPLPLTFPTIDYRLNTLTVHFRDTLERNTTYNIQFGNSIKDFTEGNVLRNFNYTFSTGNYIDSLTLEGNVILAESGAIDTTLIVMLHSNPNDSAVIKEKPRYITRLDSRGHFIFRNLPPTTFYLYALKDESGTHRYQRENQLFAFAPKPIVTGSNTAPVTLYAYSTKPPTLPFPTLTGGKNKGNTTQEKRLRYTTNLLNFQQDLLSQLKINFEVPLRNFDSSALRLYTDSTFLPAQPYSWSIDSTRKIITLNHNWKDNTNYHLVLDKSFAEDTSGRKLLKSDTIHFRTRKTSDYGSLHLRLKNVDLARHPVLLVVTGDIIYKSYPLSGNEIVEPIFLPGEYELRVLYDENLNGKWDPGEFFGKHKQPEIVKQVDRKISIKPNFTNEFDVAL